MAQYAVAIRPRLCKDSNGDDVEARVAEADFRGR